MESRTMDEGERNGKEGLVNIRFSFFFFISFTGFYWVPPLAVKREVFLRLTPGPSLSKRGEV